jgi:predicted DCC family thiol-disulfide oxidoreductase YuxK
VHTEITEYIKGWVLYDGDCVLCQRWAERTRPLLLRRGFHFVPIQAAWVRARLGHAENEPLTEMKLLAADGRILVGADAIVQITRAIWWTWPFYAIAQLPGIKLALRAIYRPLARRRHCLGNMCRFPKQYACRSARRNITSAFYELP